MLQPTRALVLRQTRYSESSLIVRMYTEQFGVQTYILNGVRSGKSRGQAALYQPPNLLDLVVYFREGRSINRIREARPWTIFQRIPYAVTHSSIALFMVEVLGKCLRDDQGQEGLFDFLAAYFLELDGSESGLTIFPHRFLLGLSAQLGFGPLEQPDTNAAWFDLREGVFLPDRPAHGHAMTPEIADVLSGLMRISIPLASGLSPRGLLLPAPAQRAVLLDQLLQYFAFHVEGFGVMRSPAILHEVLSNPKREG